ncbi:MULTISPECIES: sensor histidine kinase [Niastella]|uniref:Histidine kinase n=1 Tax=Niastella soli TaxID=2821487 RepID=A0ABS3YQD9_9BACT|nr:two-component regulator propeller domain-containing protein [Niastella soli]MBO9200023.1 histidine kinase [Niastella soli]
MGTPVPIAVELSMITKRIIQTLLLFTGFLTVCTSYAQEYNYIHYDVKDGLAGSTVYDVCQDKEGFIWFATEAGVSRFDGTHFKNFTTSDGLPETEILKLLADSKGRIWMAPFKNAVCYYYKGKIHNQENDPVLKKIKLTSVIGIFRESPDQDIAFNADNYLTVVSANNTVNQYRSNAVRSAIFLRRSPFGKGFQLNIDDSSYVISNGKMVPVPFSSVGTMRINPKLEKIRSTLKVTAEDYDPDINHPVFTNTWHGSYLMDTVTFDRYEAAFLKEKQVSHALVDSEKNIWFATLGEGVYKLASREFKTHYFYKSQSQEIFSLTKINGKIYAGTSFGRIYLLQGTAIDTINANKEFGTSLTYGSTNRVTCLQQLKDGSLLMGSDGLLVKKTSKGNVFNTRIYAVKSIEALSNGMVLVGSAKRTLLINPTDLSIQDTIYPNRTTCVCSYNNNYYIGTVNGLYMVNSHKQLRYMGEAIPSLRQRISYFCKSPDGSLWIATYGAGIICLKNDQVVKQITTQEGISSNICRTLFVNNNFLWAGTDKGLNKINLSQTPYPVTIYGTSDGLPTDIINAVYVDSNTIYVGSPAGITWFNETKTDSYSKCNLRLLDISVGNRSQPLKDSYRLGYQENSLKLHYAGISFKSGGYIWYRYRLKGLTDAWDSTMQNVLEYPSLPPGNYEFELIAINKKGIVSDPVKIAFFVAAPFWQTLPFQVLIIAVVIFITWMLVAWRFSILRKKEQERTSIEQKLNELEQMALRAQMNPHFIFNCLNSIQNFIITNDLESSNWYLSEFAQLIRQTLDNSEKSTISISNEIKYLKRYLELEMMRFGHSFNYTIEVDPELDPDMESIPTMILQPYIENSIRHGIRYRENGGGAIDIKFQNSNDGFICIIQDNGIGRKKASEYRSQVHVEYQSKGMSLTAERINILNRQLSEPITIEINDLTNAQDQATGTRITLRFPYTIT